MIIREHIKTGKVAEVNSKGQHYEVIRIDRYANPYAVRMKWWESGWHYKTVAKFSDLHSCLYYLLEVVKNAD